MVGSVQKKECTSTLPSGSRTTSQRKATGGMPVRDHSAVPDKPSRLRGRPAYPGRVSDLVLRVRAFVAFHAWATQRDRIGFAVQGGIQVKAGNQRHGPFEMVPIGGKRSRGVGSSTQDDKRLVR